MNSKTAHLVNRQFHYTWLFSSCICSPWCAKDFRCLFGFSVSGAEAVQTSRNPVPSRWLTTIGNSSSRGSKVWTHSHTLDSLRKLRGVFLNASRERTYARSPSCFHCWDHHLNHVVISLMALSPPSTPEGGRGRSQSRDQRGTSWLACSPWLPHPAFLYNPETAVRGGIAHSGPGPSTSVNQ